MPTVNKRKKEKKNKGDTKEHEKTFGGDGSVCPWMTVGHTPSFWSERKYAWGQEGLRDPSPTVKGFKSSLRFLITRFYCIFLLYKFLLPVFITLVGYEDLC